MKITKIETLKLSKYPRLLFVRVHTDNAIFGIGETYDKIAASRAAIHNSLAPAFLGNDPRDINRLWRFSFDNILFHGFAGAELRALSAIEIALWDILGKYYKMPVYRLLGGMVRKQIPTYNTCIGFYPSNDYERWQRDAGSLAEEMKEEGITGMKIWPFDKYTKNNFGQNMSKKDIYKGLKPVISIREKVDEMKIGIECHFRFSRATAEKVAHSLEPYDIGFLEDPLPATNIDEIKRLTEKINIPVVGSETLFSRWMIKEWIVKGASQIIMTDVGWTGGIAETMKIAALAEAFSIPLVLHNAGGPVVHGANMHLAACIPNLFEMECVRSFYKHIFTDLSDLKVSIKDGYINTPEERPGLGIDFLETCWKRPDADIQVSEGNGIAVNIQSMGDCWDKTDVRL